MSDLQIGDRVIVFGSIERVKHLTKTKVYTAQHGYPRRFVERHQTGFWLGERHGYIDNDGYVWSHITEDDR